MNHRGTEDTEKKTTEKRRTARKKVNLARSVGITDRGLMVCCLTLSVVFSVVLASVSSVPLWFVPSYPTAPRSPRMAAARLLSATVSKEA